MAERFTRTILSFLAVLAVYWLYALLVVPRIDPLGDPLNAMNPAAVPADLFGSDTGNKPTDRFRSLLEPIFPADSWELNEAMVLKNDQFILLVNDYKTLSEGVQIELKPCTVVLNPNAIKSQKPGEQCLILRSPEGAVLEFDRPFGVMTGGLGKLVGGRLNGEVTIRSHVPNGNQQSAAGQTTDQLEVVTSNVQMNAQQIWTPDQVRFRYGASYGSGRDLMISLAEMESSEIRRLPNETPTHLRSLELVQLDELNVTTGTQSSLTDSSPESPTTLRVHCQGPLLFDFVGGSVTLQDQVAIQRQSTKQQAPNQQHGSSSALQLQPKSDWLTCDTLAMQFQRSVKESTAEAVADGTQRQGNQRQGNQRPRWELPRFELAQISAFGSPSVVDAPTYQVRAQAEKIELHLSHNRLLLQDTNEAILQFDTHTFRAPQMQYFVDPQGGPGRAEVVGGGQYVGTLQDDVVQLLWKDSLNFGPRDGKYLLDVSGQAHIQWGKRELGKDGKSDARSKNAPLKNQLTSGQLQLWLRQQPRADRSRFQPVVHNEPAADFQLNPPRSSSDTFPVQPPMASPSGPTPPLVNPSSVVGPTKKTRPNPVGKLSENWTPDRLVARKSVRLRTPQLAADVEFAEIELEQSGIDAKASGDSLQGPTLAGPLLSNPLGNQSQAGSTERYQLAGHEVRIVMQANGPETSPRFKSVSIQGGVRLVQSSANPDVAGLDVQGTKVELTQTDEGAVGSIVGEPAIVKTQGVEVSGTEIQVDQAANRVWIDNAGLAYIPLPQNVAARFSKKTATMKIAWQGGMNFDGEAVTCDGGVEIRGPEQIATAQALRVTLVEPIRFDSAGRELNTMKSRRSRNVNEPNQILSQVALTGNVWLENRSFDDRGRASIDEFRVATLNYDQSTGQLVGEGPGTMSSKRFTQNKVDSQRSQTPQLTHTLVQFQKQLHGSLKKREVSVSDRVRAIHGPIADWKQENRFDAPSQSPDTVTMKAARLTVAQMPGNAGQPALEFTASGDTEIRGRTFVANAQHVRYAQAKDMLVMEGDGRSIVQLSHQSRIGAPRQVVKAKKIQYWIAANRLNSEGVIMGDVTVADSASKFLQRGQPYGQTQQLASPYQQPQYRGNPNAQRPLGQQPVQNYGVQNPALVNPSYGNPNMLNPANRQATPNGVYGRFPQPNRQP